MRVLPQVTAQQPVKPDLCRKNVYPHQGLPRPATNWPRRDGVPACPNDIFVRNTPAGNGWPPVCSHIRPRAPPPRCVCGAPPQGNIAMAGQPATVVPMAGGSGDRRVSPVSRHIRLSTDIIFCGALQKRHLLTTTQPGPGAPDLSVQQHSVRISHPSPAAGRFAKYAALLTEVRNGTTCGL